jgi:hypothetical protein
MTRFFFDVASRDGVCLDFRGRDFAKAEEAYEMAKLIALDVAFTEEPGNEVQVRNVVGDRLFCVRVGELDLMAA